MSARGKKEVKLVLGASPRVDLLPPEVADRKRGAAVRRSVLFGAIGAIVLVGGGYAFASWLAIQASARYDDARLETTALLAEQSKYADVLDLSDQLVTVTDAQHVGAMTEIEWNSFYQRIVPTLPAGLSIVSFDITSGSPIVALAPSSVPGQSLYAAEIALVATTTDLSTAQTWVVALKGLPEYGGAVTTSVTFDDTGVYTVAVSMLVTDAAYSHRFEPVPDPAVTPTPTEEASN